MTSLIGVDLRATMDADVTIRGLLLNETDAKKMLVEPPVSKTDRKPFYNG